MASLQRNLYTDQIKTLSLLPISPKACVTNKGGFRVKFYTPEPKEESPFALQFLRKQSNLSLHGTSLLCVSSAEFSTDTCPFFLYFFSLAFLYYEIILNSFLLRFKRATFNLIPLDLEKLFSERLCGSFPIKSPQKPDQNSLQDFAFISRME